MGSISLPFGSSLCPQFSSLGLPGDPSLYSSQEPLFCNDPCSNPYFPIVWQGSNCITWASNLGHRGEV